MAIPDLQPVTFSYAQRNPGVEGKEPARIMNSLAMATVPGTPSKARSEGATWNKQPTMKEGRNHEKTDNSVRRSR
jgi:hypothetical protein